MVAITEKKVVLLGESATKTRRVSGKPWKNISLSPTASSAVKWSDKMEERQKLKQMKALEKRLKDEKQAAKDLHRQNIVDRRKAQEEKERQQALAEKMSAKRLQRMRKKEARKKARV